MAKKCECCGGPYDGRRRMEDRCREGGCYWPLSHVRICGPHCAIHCRGLNYGPDVDLSEQDYLAACAEGRFERTMRALGRTRH